MNHRSLARQRDLRNRFSFRLSFGLLAALALLCMAAVAPARAQDAGEYAGATGMSAGAVVSTPQIMVPGSSGQPGSNVFLAKPKGPPPDQVNRELFAKQAGKDGAQLAIDAVPPQSRVWIDGKFVGQAPLSVTLPAGMHHVSLTGPRQEHADRDVEIASGKNQHLEIHLAETYPNAVSISVFGNQRH